MNRYTVRTQLNKTLAAIAMTAVVSTAMWGQTATAPKPATPAATKPWTKIPVPPLHDFKPPQPKKIVLQNGLIIFLQEDHELPFVNGSILIKGGSRDEPGR